MKKADLSILQAPSLLSDQKFTFVLPKIKGTTVLNILPAIVLLFFTLCALVPQAIAPYSPTQMLMDSVMQAPSLRHIFGTDQYGRDVFSIVVYGSRISILTGFATVFLGGLFGGILGAVSGYAGGIFDSAVMRFIEVLMTIPGILLAMLIAAVLKPSFFNVVLAISISSIPMYARVMRGEALRVKNLPYITAARSIGTSNLIIFMRHVIPNSISSFLVIATMGLGTSILSASSLSFLGLGVLQEIPDWGTLLSNGRSYITVAWWICTFPGLSITIYVLAINILGDYLRDSLAPKLK